MVVSVNLRRSRNSESEYAIESFRCRRCGACCTGNGFVNLEKQECRLIAEFLGLSLERFLKDFTLEADGYERWLIDGEGDDMPCVFLERDSEGLASCRIEPVKPRQCREFPLKWRRNGMENWCAGFQTDVSKKGASPCRK